MATSTIVILFLTLAIFAHAREIGLADTGDDAPGNKLFCGNFFNFPLPATVPPTAPPACAIQPHNMPVAAHTTACSCGSAICSAGQICTTTTAGVGTCTTATALLGCGTTAGSTTPPAPCICESANFPNLQNVCTTAFLAGCFANVCI